MQIVFVPPVADQVRAASPYRQRPQLSSNTELTGTGGRLYVDRTEAPSYHSVARMRSFLCFSTPPPTSPNSRHRLHRSTCQRNLQHYPRQRCTRQHDYSFGHHPYGRRQHLVFSAAASEQIPRAFLATLIPLSLLTLRRHRLPRLTSGVLICLLLAASGCGAGRTIPLESGTSPSSPPPSGPATPAGTYTVVASATGLD